MNMVHSTQKTSNYLADLEVRKRALPALHQSSKCPMRYVFHLDEYEFVRFKDLREAKLVIRNFLHRRI
jgi:hypothetical protein